MKKILSLSILSIGLTFQSNALETDQFIASKFVIKDSADVLNRYFDVQIEKALSKVNQKNPDKIKCSEVADMVMNNLVGGKYFGISKVSQYAKKSPEVDKFPDNSISDREYAKMTYYENSDITLKLAPLARTININGIYMGTDKLGHFALVGRNYYHNYLSYKKKGQDAETAKRNAILKGFATERGILGFMIGGVLSYGDLEANYEGMNFAINMCEGENPHLILKNGRFEKNENNLFDIRNYFNPRMDESFHFSFWRPGLFKRIFPKLKKEYCETKDDPMYLERIAKYPSLLTENLNDRLIKETILNVPKFDRKLQDVETFCNQ
jgi:hypothetical protein